MIGHYERDGEIKVGGTGSILPANVRSPARSA